LFCNELQLSILLKNKNCMAPCVYRARIFSSNGGIVMPRPQRPFIIQKRNDSKTFFITLSTASGLSSRICREWQRKSFQNLPMELVGHHNPRTKSAAEAGAFALIQYLKNTDSRHVPREEMKVGSWLRKFTSMEESPKGFRNVAENRPYSVQSVERLKSLYDTHMKDDPFMELLIKDVDVTDSFEFINRMALRKLGGRYKNKIEQPKMRGTETFGKLVKFCRMAFKEYGKTHPYWMNPFRDIDPPRNIKHTVRDALPEDEVVKLFMPGVLTDVIDVAVCAVMFLSGLRRSEISALRPEDLDWSTPKITVCQAWQNFNYKRRVMGPTKSKKERDAPFDAVLQEAIRKLWKENGKQTYVFSTKKKDKVKVIGPSWIKGRFKKWLARAGIELKGRQIVPHSSRHSLASLLEERGVSLRYIQDLLGHSDLKTTKTYLHSTAKTIRDIGSKIDDAMVGESQKEAEQQPIILKIS
jgi:integrase/recombinase XerD